MEPFSRHDTEKLMCGLYVCSGVYPLFSCQVKVSLGSSSSRFTAVFLCYYDDECIQFVRLMGARCHDAQTCEAFGGCQESHVAKWSLLPRSHLHLEASGEPGTEVALWRGRPHLFVWESHPSSPGALRNNCNIRLHQQGEND